MIGVFPLWRFYSNVGGRIDKGEIAFDKLRDIGTAVSLQGWSPYQNAGFGIVEQGSYLLPRQNVPFVHGPVAFGIVFYQHTPRHAVFIIASVVKALEVETPATGRMAGFGEYTTT